MSLFGIIHGKTIELTEATPLADGQKVEVIVRPVKGPSQPGEGFLRTEGALQDDSEWDGIMEEIQNSRRIERRQPDEML